MREFSVINSVSQFHALLGLDPPKHPLVSVINSDQACFRPELGQTKYIFQVYTVAQKSGVAGALGYGRNPYDFQTGTLVFTSPGQVISKQQLEKSTRVTPAWTLLFHPDLIRTACLGQTIDTYSFFAYQAHEALHISQEESQTLGRLIQQLQAEYDQVHES